MSHNRITPKGTFHFETLSRGIFCGQQVGTKFKSLPLDAAYHWSTCVRHHPAKDLTMCIKIKVVMEDGNGHSPFNGRDIASRGHFFSMLKQHHTMHISLEQNLNIISHDGGKEGHFCNCGDTSIHLPLTRGTQMSGQLSL